MVKVCVTGGTGFVGSKLCMHLSNLSYDVIVPVRKLIQNFNNLNKNIKFIEFELSANTDYHKILKNVDVVIHCAAKTEIIKETNKKSLLEFQKVNVEDTLKLATHALQFGVKRFIFLSSVKVNGEQTSLSDSFKYDDIPKPEDAYGASKLEAEEALKNLSNRTGLEIVIIRAPLVYGEGVKGNFLRLLKLCRSIMPLPFANVRNIRSMVSVYNLIDLIELCINHDKAAGEIFLVSDAKSISTTELIKKLRKAMIKPARLFVLPLFIFKFFGILFRKSSEIDKLFNSCQVDISHTCKVLDWKPKFNIDSSLEKTVNYYLKNL